MPRTGQFDTLAHVEFQGRARYLTINLQVLLWNVRYF